MDKVDFDLELARNFAGNKVYPSLESLRKHKKCLHECGIVKVQVTLLEVIQEGTV